MKYLLFLLLTSCSQPSTCPKDLPEGYRLITEGNVYIIEVELGNFISHKNRQYGYTTDTFDYLQFIDSCKAKKAAWEYYLTNGEYLK